MIEAAFSKQAIINVTALDPGDLRCPVCKSNTIVVSGQAQVPQREVREAGVVTHTIVDSSDGGTFDVTRLDCVTCSTTFHLRNAEVFRLESEVLDLKYRIGELQRQTGDYPEDGPGGLGPEYGFRN